MQLRPVSCWEPDTLLMTDTLEGVLLSLAQAFGGNLGWAIVALSFGIRATLLPLTLHLARRARRNLETARAFQPEIDALRRQFEKQPELLMGEIQKVYRKHNYSPFDLFTIVGSLIQLPIFGMLYGAIRQAVGSADRFLWIRSLAGPDFLLTLVVVSLTGFSAWVVPSTATQAKTLMICIQIAITGFMVWKLSAGLSLYWLSSGLVGLIQNLLLRWSTRARVAQA